jgi:hypothetical protein
MRRFAIPAVLLTVTYALITTVAGATPNLVNYQGFLTDTDGLPLSGTYDLTFAIYPDSVTSYHMWLEVHGSVDVENGLFNVLLGSISPFPENLFGQYDKWLGVAVNEEEELSPRMRMTSVPWALRAAVADTALAGVGGGPDNDWTVNGDDMYSAVPGLVGVHTPAPLAHLHVERTDIALTEAALLNEDLIIEDADAVLGIYSNLGGSYGSALSLGEVDGGALTSKWTIFRTTGNTPDLRFSVGSDPSYANNAPVLTLEEGGVGVGTTSPARNLEIVDPTRAYLRLTTLGTNQASTIELKGSRDGTHPKMGAINFLDLDDVARASVRYTCMTGPFPYWYMMFETEDGLMAFTDEGRLGIGTSSPSATLDVQGTAMCEVLEITGGADLAEPFDVGGAEIEPGMVVCIDPDHPGRLKPSDQPYDRCVAGVVSGAGGIDAGLLMGRRGSLADGAHPVALTGRVYCRATAANGSLKPGDLLTTASQPGHAMKAADHGRAQGAVLGKAMTPLAEGDGLILVLVTLQ